MPIVESFADVLHTLVDHVLSGDLADKAHAVIDQASGTRTLEPETDAPPEAETTAPGDTSVPADATAEAPADATTEGQTETGT